MAEAIFYVLATESQIERQRFACRLIEKIYRNGQYCYVLTDSVRQSQQMDDLLWTFRAGSFVPHSLYQGDVPTNSNEILINGEPIPENWLAIIVNLSSQPPKQFAQCEKIVEILDSSENSRKLGRQRYRFYQQAGLEITTHNMADRLS
jgi:DNA polymerase-3 subunit chi